MSKPTNSNSFDTSMEISPAHFYKYRDLSGGAENFVERIFSNSELFFSKPSAFNDPFDCRASFLFEGSDKEFSSWYERVLKKHEPNLSKARLRKEAKLKLLDPQRSPRNPETQKRVQELHTEQITEKIGILCLSRIRDDILMWSHYSNAHQGICLEFDGKYEFFANAQKVIYRVERPRINPFRQTPKEMMEAALLTKAAHWEYEQEWRFIQYSRGPGIYKFPPQALTGVILGAQISPAAKNKVLDWIEQRTSPMKVFRAVPSDSRFLLNIEESTISSLRT